MRIVQNSISLEELKKMSEKMYDSLVKAVVDIEKEVMVVDAGMHADEELLLLEEGSEQVNLWGINIYPYKNMEDWVEFDSMINIRPSYGNRTRGIEDVKIQEKIKQIVAKLVVL